MKLLRLRGRKTCDRLLRLGRVWKGKNLQVRWMEGAPRHPSTPVGVAAVYAGTLASTKLDKSAVNRNRMRRRCREALRLALQDTPDFASVQLLIVPRSSSLRVPFEQILGDIRAFLSTQSHARPRTEKR